jgi:hypothetical protein
LVSSQGQVAMSPFASGACENVRDVFLLLDDISGGGGRCQR